LPGTRVLVDRAAADSPEGLLQRLALLGNRRREQTRSQHRQLRHIDHLAQRAERGQTCWLVRVAGQGRQFRGRRLDVPLANHVDQKAAKGTFGGRERRLHGDVNVVTLQSSHGLPRGRHNLRLRITGGCKQQGDR
jgi:hypothetical protein